MTACVYMIRHGHAAAWGDPGSVRDPGLDELGRVQARAACAALLCLADRPRLIVTWPLQRCRETATPFARALGVEPVVEPRVAEIPTPSALAQEARSAWLREAFGTTRSEITGDLDYTAWRDSVAAAVAARPGAAIFTSWPSTPRCPPRRTIRKF